MVKRQRELIAAGNYVAEGRDIGTVVSPDSPLKVFLTASEEERARRRAAETGASVEEVREAIEDRDSRDRGREHGALRAADDSVEVDTTDLTPDEVVERIAASPASGGSPDGGRGPRPDAPPAPGGGRGRFPERRARARWSTGSRAAARRSPTPSRA